MAELIIFTLHLSLPQPVLQSLKSQYLPRIMPLVILLQCQLDLVWLPFINSIPPMGKIIPLNIWKGWEFSYQVGLHWTDAILDVPNMFSKMGAPF